MAGKSPTERTFDVLGSRGLQRGFDYDIVERFLPGVHGHGIRKDFLGIIDFIVLDPEKGLVGIQSTGNDFSGHLNKLKHDRPVQCLKWLRFPHAKTSLELWAWRKVKEKRGSKREVYKPRILEITEDIILDGRSESDLVEKEEEIVIGSCAMAPPLQMQMFEDY